MSVIAWDGRYIASDQRGINCGYYFMQKKLHVWKNAIIGVVGDQCAALSILEWFKRGAPEDHFPAIQSTDAWARCIIATARNVEHYEQTPFPIDVHEPFMAWGSGRDFALGAMAAGKNAIQAVEITCQLCVSCGNGIQAYDLKTMKEISHVDESA